MAIIELTNDHWHERIEEAREDGYADGQLDGHSEGYDEGYEEGYTAGIEEAQYENDHLRAQLEAEHENYRRVVDELAAVRAERDQLKGDLYYETKHRSLIETKGETS